MFGFDGPFSSGPLTISPVATLRVSGSGFTFSASGGTGGGYVFSFVTNNSGGTINSGTGAYVPGATPNVTDTIRVTDSGANTADGTVDVKAPIVITPSIVTVPPLGTQDFNATGGVSTPGFQFVVNNSGGSLDGTTGLYTAGAIPDVVDTIRATDVHNNEDLATINVGIPIVISPEEPTVYVGGTEQFTATGGSETGYTWSLLVNDSGGSIDPVTGLYTAGPLFGETDTVQVEDSLGNTATTDVNVSNAIATWDIEVSPDTQGHLRFTMLSGAAFDLSLVHEGDLAYIYGDEFADSNTNGTYTIQLVSVTYDDGDLIAWFEIENPLGEELLNVEQIQFESLMFFRPKRRTIYDNPRRVIVCERAD